MFKEEKILIRLSLLLLLLLSTTLYFGQSEVIYYWLSFFGLNTVQAIEFAENIFLVENGLFPEKFNIYMGILGYIFSFNLIIILRILVKPKRKHVIFSGVSLLTMGFIEMFLMDISVIGWLAGPMLMIAGFLLYRKSRLFF